MDWIALGGWIVAVATLAWRAIEYFNSKPSVDKVASATAEETVGKAWATLYGEMRTRLGVVEQQNKEQAAEMSLMRAASGERDRKLFDQDKHIAEQTAALAHVTAEFEALRKRMAAWQVGIRKLLDQLAKAEMIPAWTPDDDSGH